MANTPKDDDKDTKPLDPAKAENAMNKAKRKAERGAAEWTSPEQKTYTGEDVHPAQKVVPSQPNPENDDELKNTRYDRDFDK